MATLLSRTRRAGIYTGRLAAAIATLLAATAGLAAPMNYAITSGEIIVTASSGGVFLADPVEMAADGQQIELDLMPGSEQVISLLLTGTGPVSAALTPPIDGYDTLRVDSLSLSGGPGALIPIGPVGSDFEYFAVIEDLVLDTSFALVDGALPDDPGSAMIPLGTGTAQLFVGLSGDELTLSGFVVADFEHPDFAGPVTLKTDFNFTAVPSVPEPSSAIVFAIGLLPVAGALRRRSNRGS